MMRGIARWDDDEALQRGWRNEVLAAWRSKQQWLPPNVVPFLETAVQLVHDPNRLTIVFPKTAAIGYAYVTKHQAGIARACFARLGVAVAFRIQSEEGGGSDAEHQTPVSPRSTGDGTGTGPGSPS